LPQETTVIFEGEPLTSGEHLGGPIGFGPDGKLFVLIGEDDKQLRADLQKLDNLKGKVLWLNPDGTIPQDNPFFTSTTGQRRAIWAMGFRQPFTFAVEPGSNRIFVGDVGADITTSFEEINVVEKGGNYGWPDHEGASSSGSRPRGISICMVIAWKILVYA